MVKNLSIWKFLDLSEDVEDSLTYESGENFSIGISGWEIRFGINLNPEDVTRNVEYAQRRYEGLIENFKNNVF